MTNLATDIENYNVESEKDLSDFSAIGDASSVACACCDYYYSEDRKFVLPSDLITQNYSPSSTKCCTVIPSNEVTFAAKITINAPAKKISILTCVQSVNRSGDSAYAKVAGSRQISDADFETLKSDAIEQMSRVWNAAAKTMNIITDKCEVKFDLSFEVREVTENSHYTINFIYVPDYRSFVAQSQRDVLLNMADPDSSNGHSSSTLEPHEYGHMLGLLDEYEEFVDLTGDGDGTDYVIRPFDPKDSRSISVDGSATDEEYATALAEADVMFGVDEGVSNYDEWQYESDKKAFLPGRHWYMELERDIGAASYRWPSYTPYGAISSPDTDGLMGNMIETMPIRREYFITIVWAVAEIMKNHGENILEITLD